MTPNGCDLCDRPLPEGTAPEVDLHGRPVSFLCPSCNDREVQERTARRRKAVRDADKLVAQFQELLERKIRPLLRMGH